MYVSVVHTGKEQQTKQDDKSKIAEKAQSVPVKAGIEANFAEVTSSPTKKAEFEATFTKDVSKAAGVSPALIKITGLESGSVIVSFDILPDTSSTTAASPAAVAMNLAVQAADPNSVLRQGTLTSSVTVTVPAGIEELAQENASPTSAGAIPQYFSACEPKTYTPGLDMKRCYTCCTFLCQTGVEVPQIGGTDVLPGFRAQTCQRLCLSHADSTERGSCE